MNEMKSRNCIVLWVFALVVVVACSSKQVTQQPPVNPTTSMARPDHIWIYDFVASPADAPARADESFQNTPQTAEQIQMGHELVAQIADELIADVEGHWTSSGHGARRDDATGQ